MMNMQKKNNLDYRVRYNPLNGHIYAGQVRRESGKWEGKPEDVTFSAMFAVAQKLCNEDNDILLILKDGRVVNLSAVFSTSLEMETPHAGD